MSAFFFDSSSLVKRFSREKGSAWVISLLKPSADNIVYVARIASVEVVSALTRRSRGGSISYAQSGKAIRRFERVVVTRYHAVEIRPTIINRAIELAKVHGLRGYDAVQLAAALTVNDERNVVGASRLTLVSADKELNTAAQWEGIVVENPDNH